MLGGEVRTISSALAATGESIWGGAAEQADAMVQNNTDI